MQETREIRALAIAATIPLRPGRNGWRVPSQTGEGGYTVDPDVGTCSCPDHETRAVECKHILAVRFTIRREKGKGGAYRYEKRVDVTYTQQWSSYNAAQCEEKDRFVELLADLCRQVPQPVQGFGRKRLPLSDMTFAATYKVYSRFSSRRFTSDLRDAHSRGLIGSAPHFNSVSNYLSSPVLTPVLRDLITVSALPLKAVETDFAVDSTGFSTSRFVKWFNKKYGREIDNREWIKLHAMCGVQTHIVTSAEVTGWSGADTNFFRPLVAATGEHFMINEVSADKAYLSHANVDAVEKFGGTPYIPFKSNTLVPTDDGAWARMYHLFAYNRQAFLDRYHQRSNVETVFSMIKGKFGDSVLSKSDTGQMNEALAKVLCHNICVVIASIHELGIEAELSGGELARIMTTPSLEGCWAKVGRAEEQFHSLHAELRGWVGDGANFAYPEPKLASDGWYDCVVKFVNKPDIFRWGAMVGEIVHNLRSALDNLVWQLVLLNRCTPTDDNQFPITDIERGIRGVRKANWQGALKRKRLEGVAPHHLARIKLLQPHCRGNKANDHPFAILRDLSNPIRTNTESSISLLPRSPTRQSPRGCSRPIMPDNMSMS